MSRYWRREGRLPFTATGTFDRVLTDAWEADAHQSGLMTLSGGINEGRAAGTHEVRFGGGEGYPPSLAPRFRFHIHGIALAA
ncbi:MAG: hypothetical protein H8K03_14540 [Nitrospira sp.]